MRHRKLTTFVALLPAVGLGAPVVADILIVPSAMYPTIQTAIDGAGAGDEIVVAPGTYPETIDFTGKSITVRSSGGAEVTTIDGTGLNDSVVKCVSGEGPDTVLTGFTITGGTGNPAAGGALGGGMYIDGSSPTVISCIFQGNTAWRGGGLLIRESQALVKECLFTENTAEFGGGCYLVDSNATIENDTFVANIADGGGGLTCVRDTPIVSGCVFEDNEAIQTAPVIFGTGGAVLNVFGSPILTECRFKGNSADEGGAVFNRESTVRVVRCEFDRNNAWVSGGAVASEISDVSFEGSSLYRNRASLWGGGIQDVAGRLTVERSTFKGNNAGDSGGAIRTFFTNGTVRNSILSDNFLNGVDPVQGGALNIQEGSDIAIDHCTFRDNRAPLGAALALGDPDYLNNPSQLAMANCILADSGTEIWNNDNSSATIVYSNVRGGLPGVGNIDVYPRFLGLDDSRLLPNSPSINAGDPNSAVEPGETDFDTQPRLQGCRVDMGAYESQIQQVVLDFDGNHRIDLKDFAAFQSCMGAEVSAAPWADSCVCAFDAVQDGRIDVADFTDFPAYMGDARQPPPQIDRLVPTPGEWVVNGVGLQEVQIGFTEEVLIPPDVIDVWTVGGGTVAEFATIYDDLSNILTVQFASPIRDDRVTVVVDYLVTGLTGAELDGEITDPANAVLPSGDEVRGGKGVFRIHVLQGDTNRDGVVDAVDKTLIGNSLKLCDGDPGFDAMADLNDDGCVDATDENIVTVALGHQLPTLDGVPPTVASIETDGPFGSFDTVDVRFSELYMPFTGVDQRSCFLVDTDGNVIVPTLVGSSGFGNALLFFFQPGLSSCDGYTINISNEVSDSSGELLVAPGPLICP